MQLSKQHKLYLLIVCGGAVALAFYLFNPFALYFLNDDLVHIPLSKDGVLFQRKSFRPIGDLSIQFDYFLWNTNAAGYHLTNLLLHIINTCLVFILSKTLIKKYKVENAIWQSLLVTILFFVYAFHSETVFWILGRSASLGTLFFIPAIYFYLKRHSNASYFLAAILCFLSGLLAYESVWIFPFCSLLISIIDIRRFKTLVKKEIWFVSVVFILFAVYLFVRFKLLGEVAGSYEASAFFAVDVKNLSLNLVRLIVRCFAPPVNSLYAFGLIAFSIFTVLVFCLYSKVISIKNLMQLVGGLLLLSFLPYLSLGVDTHTVEGERFLYMPSIFASMVIVEICVTFIKDQRLLLGSFTLILFFHLFFLKRSRDNYTTASNISQTALEQVNLLKNKKNLFIDSLPQSFNGALIFRSGFNEGFEWLKNTSSVDQVIILSLKKANKNWAKNYRVSYKTSFVETPFPVILIPDTTQQKTYVTKEVRGIKYNPSTDARFIFNDSSLTVIK